MTEIEDRIRALKARIQRACEDSGRDPAAVELLPVSKHQDLALVREASRSGFHRFGENYVQEGASKAEAAPDLEFILLGPLQRNKVRQALKAFQEIQTLDRPELAQRMRRIAQEEGLLRPVWIQVDLWDEASKAGGCSEKELPLVIQALDEDPALPLQGFMALPPPGEASAFQEMALLRGKWQEDLGIRLKLSMGMTGDFEAAISAGSDQVRIGTAFFGERS